MQFHPPPFRTQFSLVLGSYLKWCERGAKGRESHRSVIVSQPVPPLRGSIVFSLDRGLTPAANNKFRRCAAEFTRQPSIVPRMSQLSACLDFSIGRTATDLVARDGTHICQH